MRVCAPLFVVGGCVPWLAGLQQRVCAHTGVSAHLRHVGQLRKRGVEQLVRKGGGGQPPLFLGVVGAGCRRCVWRTRCVVIVFESRRTSCPHPHPHSHPHPRPHPPNAHPPRFRGDVRPDDWSGKPGDGFFYLTHAYVSEVLVRVDSVRVCCPPPSSLHLPMSHVLRFRHTHAHARAHAHAHAHAHACALAHVPLPQSVLTLTHAPARAQRPLDKPCVCCARLPPASPAPAQVTPYNEPNDVVYPATYDQPDGCTPYYLASGVCHRLWQDLDPWLPATTTPDPGVLACPAPGAGGQGGL
jgi:hypothetical protein